MPIHFTRLSPALIEAAAAAQVLTPNERLAREFVAAYAQHQLDQGRTAWPRPKVASMQRYLRTHRQAQQEDDSATSSHPKLLSRDAELLLWGEAAEPDRAHLAELAANSWALAKAWRISLDVTEAPATREVRYFRRLAHRFAVRLRQDNLLTEAQLPDLPDIHKGAALHLFAFDQAPPQRAAFLQRVRGAGETVRHHPAPSRRPTSEGRIAYKDRNEEIRAAVQWSRQILQQDPHARIGIVFPYLAERHHAISHAFFVEFQDAPEAYDISGGTPLAAQPVWRCARRLLAHLLEPTAKSAAELPAAPFLNLEGARGQALLRALARHASSVQAQTFAAWANLFASWLGQAQWGVGAGSVQHQALQAAKGALGQYAALAKSPPCGGAQALRTLDDLLALKTFAPQRPPAPIQALGYLETAGLAFTHLWVAGLTDTGWPTPRPSNPLLPMDALRAQGVPRIDQRTEEAFARRLTEQWRHAGEHLIFSWPQEDEGEEHRCSALIQDIPEAPADEVIKARRRCWHPWLAAAPTAQLQEAAPDQGSALAEGALQGGATLLRNQALCPFRAWAVHRLGLRDERTAEELPNAMIRGLLLHEALHMLYRDAEPAHRKAAIDQAVGAAIESEIPKAPAIYRQNEHSRIAAIVARWLELDALRPAFQTVGLEQEALLTLDGAQCKLRIDRMDEDSASGQRIVIDYKTGLVSLTSLSRGRLIEPQLAMYALTDASIGAVCVASLRNGEVKLTGWAMEELQCAVKSKVDIKPLREASWQTTRQRWRKQLEALAREHRQGLATVAPNSRNVCRNCHLGAFCRVQARTPDRNGATAGGGDGPP